MEIRQEGHTYNIEKYQFGYQKTFVITEAILYNHVWCLRNLTPGVIFFSHKQRDHQIAFYFYLKALLDVLKRVTVESLTHHSRSPLNT